MAPVTPLPLADCIRGSSLPAHVGSVTGHLQAVQPIGPGLPLRFTILVVVSTPSSLPNGKPLEERAKVTVFTAPLLYPSDAILSSTQVTVTTNSPDQTQREAMQLAKTFEAIHEAMHRCIGRQITILIDTQNGGRLDTRVISKERTLYPDKKSVKIGLRMNMGLRIQAEDEHGVSTVYELLDPSIPPSSFFSTSSRDTEAPPCAQATPTYSTRPTPTYTTRPSSSLNATAGPSTPTLQARTRRSVSPSNSEQGSKRRKTSTDNISRAEQGKNIGDGSHLANGTKLGKGKQRIDYEIEDMESGDEEPSLEKVKRPRTRDDFDEWKERGPPVVQLSNSNLPITYRTMDSINANEKTHCPNDKWVVPKSWNLMAVVTDVGIQAFRPGNDHIVNLTLIDPTRYEAGDYFRLTCFSKWKMNLTKQDMPAGSVILIRNAHPKRGPNGRMNANCAASQLWSFAILSSNSPRRESSSPSWLQSENWVYGEGRNDPRTREAGGLTEEEREYMVDMLEWYRVCYRFMGPIEDERPRHIYKDAISGVNDESGQPVAKRVNSGVKNGKVKQNSKSVVSPPLSKEMCTIHGTKQVWTIPEIIACSKVPARFRVQAGLVEIFPVEQDNWRDCLIKWCTTCRRSFSYPHCEECNDIQYKNAEHRFRMIAFIGDETPGNKLPLLINHEDMFCLLPELPKMAVMSTIDDKTVSSTKKAFLNLFLGQKESGSGPRPRYPIDWSIEAFWMTDPNGEKHRMFKAIEMC